MSKIAYLLRQTSKASEESAVYVRHSHKGSSFTKATGVSVHPKYFDADSGKVIKVPMAPEYNKTIQHITSVMETAARNLLGKGVEPDKSAMEKEYQKELDEREGFERWEKDLFRPEVQAFGIEKLKQEIAVLEATLVKKKFDLEQAELMAGVHEGKLLSRYIMDYRKAREATLKPNSLRLFDNVAHWVTQFRPMWRIDEVTIESLRDFQNYLLAQGKRSLTVADIITKTKSVVYYFARTLKIDTAEIKEFKLDFKKKKNANIIYLTKEELADLIALPIPKPTEALVRDMFVVMSLTGVRYSDVYITRDHIVNGQIQLSTEKTDTDVMIPMSDTVKEILERHDYGFRYVPASNFNKYIKDICSRIPSLSERKELVKTYKGGKVTKQYVTKDQLVTCHVGRKTFINLALEKGINPVAIADIVGHEGTQLIMSTYGSSQAGREAIGNLWE